MQFSISHHLASCLDIEIIQHAPQVWTMKNLLSHSECDELIAMAEPLLSESVIVVNDTTGATSAQPTYRQSFSTYLERGESVLLEQIEDRMDQIFKGGDRGEEPLHILKYLPGGFYMPHHDWFKVRPSAGQRVATLLMYLNTPVDGGETYFPKLDITIKPTKGSGLFFCYDNCDPMALHESMVLKSGVKYVVTKWFRV